MEKYYHQHMNKEQQMLYQAMYSGITKLQQEFLIPKADAKILQDTFFLMRLDHPEIFWVSGFRYKYYPDSPNIIMIPEYLFEKNKIKEHQKAIQTRVERLVRPAMKMTELEKEQYIHDFICENVKYDKLKKAYSHEVIGPLSQGVGVCEGIAKSVKLLCDALGIWCMIALCDNNPEKGIKYRHTWNIIKINKAYYHLDATFDNSLTRQTMENAQIRYDYFNIDDKSIFRDHEPLIAPAPKCTEGDLFYYKNKKLSFTKKEEVLNRAKQAAKKGKILVFHWRGGYLTREVFAELLEMIDLAGKEKNKNARISVNWPRAIISVAYTDEREHEIIMEEANEGEQL